MDWRHAIRPAVLLAAFCLFLFGAQTTRERAALESAGRSLDAGDYKSALAKLMSVEDSGQNDPGWHRMAARAHHGLGNIEPAIQHLQKAIRLAPDQEQYYLDLGEVLSQNNARVAVVTVLEAATEALPESFRLRLALGVGYLKIRDYEKAKHVFQGLLETRPNDETLLALLAESHDIANDWENAAAAAARLRALNGNNSAGWYYGAKAEYEMNRQAGANLQLAEQYARRAIRLEPDGWRAHLLLGKLLAESGRDPQAVTALRKAIALKSEDPNTYYILARALQRLGRTSESKQAFQAYNQARAAHRRNQRSLKVEMR